MGLPSRPSSDEKSLPSYAICHSLSVKQPCPEPQAFVDRVHFLALLIYLNFTALLFAIWNVSANRAAGLHGESLELDFVACSVDSCHGLRQAVERLP
jgi:hypothetical protein